MNQEIDFRFGGAAVQHNTERKAYMLTLTFEEMRASGVDARVFGIVTTLNAEPRHVVAQLRALAKRIEGELLPDEINHPSLGGES